MNKEITKNEEKQRVETLKKKEEGFKVPKKRPLEEPKLYKINFDFHDVEKSYTNLLNKYSTYFKEKIDEYLLNNKKSLKTMTSNELNTMLNELLDTNFTFDMYPSDGNLPIQKLVTSLVSKKDFKVAEEDVTILYLDIFNSFEKGKTIIIPVGDFQLPKKLRKNIYYLKYYSPRNRDKILSLEDTLAFCYLVDKAQKVLKNVIKENFSGKESFPFTFLYADDYTMEKIDCMENFDDSKYQFAYPYWYKSSPCHLIVEAFAILREKSYSDMLEEKYNKGLKSDYAKSFEDKKTVTDKVKSVMVQSLFNKDFINFEIDQDTDLKKFKQIEEEFIRLKKIFNFNEFFKIKRPSLRFRRLGQHRALGLYYPHVNCVCVDIKSPKSFFHEIGHCIDYTIEDSIVRLSAKLSFSRVIYNYRDLYNAELEKIKDTPTGKYLTNKKGYFFNQTEIFARSFEIYLSKVKKIESSFLKDTFPLSGGYVFSDEYLKNLTIFFDNLMQELSISLPENKSTLLTKDEIDRLEPYQIELNSDNTKTSEKNTEPSKEKDASKDNTEDNIKISKAPKPIENVTPKLSKKSTDNEKVPGTSSVLEDSKFTAKIVALTNKKNKGQLTITFI
ncbi:TPA: hypothetical protein ACF0PM_002169 [Clostridium perfringens]